MKKNASVIFAGLFAFGLLAFVSKSMYQDPWLVPDAFKKKVNPLKGDAASVVTGKALYNQYCKSCHGTKGKGDGPRASQLDTESSDFTTTIFKTQTDGGLYYKTETGRKDMPSFKTIIPDVNSIWAVINYLRTLK